MAISFTGLLHALTVSVAMAVPTPQDDRVEAHIALKNTSPRYISSILMDGNALQKHPGARISWRTGVDEIVVKAGQAEVEEIKTIIRLLDVPQMRLSLEVRVIRLAKNAEAIKEEVLADTKLFATNNHPLTVGATDPEWESQAKVLPRINGDGTVSIRVWFDLSFAGSKSESNSVARRLRPGETFVVNYPNPSLRFRAVPDWEDKTRLPFYKYGYRVEAKVVSVVP